MSNEDKKVKSQSLPADFEKQTKEKYEASCCKKLVSFDDFLEHEKILTKRLAQVAANPKLAYKPTLGSMTPCGNGDFDTLLDQNEWQAANGLFPDLSNPFPFSSFTAGFSSNMNTADPLGHQTWVAGPAMDPFVPIATTAQGSLGAVRVGNAFNWPNSEMPCSVLSKTFVVNAANKYITFWYAVVLHDPTKDHSDPGGSPFFQVRVTDASGNIIPNAFDFGNGKNVLIGGGDPSSDLLFEKIDVDSTLIHPTISSQKLKIYYKDWSCAQIDLSTQIDKQVTIEFVTSDCAYTGHFGYAYIDNFCGNCKGSPTGDISYDCENSSHCGAGNICFNYELPDDKKDPKTGVLLHGSVVITLNIYQNGALVTSVVSPPQTSETSYCFDINPATIAGLNMSLGGFDFTASGEFFIGSISLGNRDMGVAPDGMNTGLNNDYAIACRTCGDIREEQNAYLAKKCADKRNKLVSYDCNCPDSLTTTGGCGCGDKDTANASATNSSSTAHDSATSYTSTSAKPSTTGGCGCGGDTSGSTSEGCIKVDLGKIKPCISVSWGDSNCDCMETDDVETLCITVCNCYENIIFDNFSIGQMHITNMDGTPVALLPDGTSSLQVIPSGPICFGDIPPCTDGKPSCISREFVLYTRGAVGKDYRLSFEGICYAITSTVKSKERCFVVSLCKDE